MDISVTLFRGKQIDVTIGRKEEEKKKEMLIKEKKVKKWNKNQTLCFSGIKNFFKAAEMYKVLLIMKQGKK